MAGTAFFFVSQLPLGGEGGAQAVPLDAIDARGVEARQ